MTPTRPGPPPGLSLQGDIEYRPDRPLSYRARVRWTNPVTSTRHSKSEAFVGRTQAEAWFEEMQRLARGGVDPYSATMTLAQYGDSIMPLAMRGLEPKTLDPYLSGWRHRVVPTLWPPRTPHGHQRRHRPRRAQLDRRRLQPLDRCWPPRLMRMTASRSLTTSGR